jgi:hypothetical protein
MIVRPVRHRPACRGVPRETFAVDPLEASNYRAAGYGGGVIEHVCARHSRNAERARSPAKPATGAPPADARSPAGASVIARSGRHAGGLAPMKVSARSVDGSRSNRDLRALARADLGLVRVTVVITASQACPHANRAPLATPQPSRSRTAVGAARRSGRGSGALSSSAASAQLHKLCRATIHAFHLTIRRHLERLCCEYCIELDVPLVQTDNVDRELGIVGGTWSRSTWICSPSEHVSALPTANSVAAARPRCSGRRPGHAVGLRRRLR